MDPILQGLAAGDLALLHHMWLWSAGIGQNAKIEEMKAYESTKGRYVNVALLAQINCSLWPNI